MSTRTGANHVDSTTVAEEARDVPPHGSLKGGPISHDHYDLLLLFSLATHLVTGMTRAVPVATIGGEHLTDICDALWM